MSELKTKRDRLLDIAAEFMAFSQSERFAALTVRALGYDPAAAGRAAKKIAFELGTDIEDRDENYRKLDRLLKFSFDAKRQFYNPYDAGR